jgi:hypothetical protein
MKIAILNIATNNYKLFLNDLHDSIEKYFLTDYKKTYFVWSDDSSYKFKHNVHHIEIECTRISWRYLIQISLFFNG